MYRAKNDFHRAGAALAQALAIRAAAYAPLSLPAAAPSPAAALTHPATAAATHRLGTLRFAQGDYPGAKRLLDAALAAQEALLGLGHVDTARTLQVRPGRLDSPLVPRSRPTNPPPLPPGAHLTRLDAVLRPPRPLTSSPPPLCCRTWRDTCTRRAPSARPCPCTTAPSRCALSSPFLAHCLVRI